MINTRLYIRCFSKVITYFNPIILFFECIKKAFFMYKNENIFAQAKNIDFKPNFDVMQKAYVRETAEDTNINFCNKIV